MREIGVRFDRFMELDDVAYAALQRGDDATVKRIFLGPELRLLRPDGAPLGGPRPLRGPRRARRRRRRSTTHGTTRASGLIAVGLGAGLVIVLLLVTAIDIARLAIEGERHVRARSDD